MSKWKSNIRDLNRIDSRDSTPCRGFYEPDPAVSSLYTPIFTQMNVDFNERAGNFTVDILGPKAELSKFLRKLSRFNFAGPQLSDDKLTFTGPADHVKAFIGQVGSFDKSMTRDLRGNIYHSFIDDINANIDTAPARVAAAKTILTVPGAPVKRAYDTSITAVPMTAAFANTNANTNNAVSSVNTSSTHQHAETTTPVKRPRMTVVAAGSGSK